MYAMEWPEKIRGEHIDNTLARVLAWAYSVFEYQSDLEVWGVPERWATVDEMQERYAVEGVVRGDCEDFAGLCVHALRRIGIVARFCVCTVETGGLHCVCIAKDFVKYLGETVVLDNRNSQPVPFKTLQRIGYEFLTLGGKHEGDEWVELRVQNG